MTSIQEIVEIRKNCTVLFHGTVLDEVASKGVTHRSRIQYAHRILYALTDNMLTIYRRVFST